MTPPKVKVLVRHSFDLIEEWGAEYAEQDHIEFYYNDGTSCADNIIKALLAFKHKHKGCLCRLQSSRVLEIDGVPVAPPSDRQER